MHFEIYRQSRAGSPAWCWRLRGANEGIVAFGEGYESRLDCLNAVDIVRGTNSLTPILDEPEK
jgi:uncharacterized protein YegP (UPF0339 family)